MYETNWRHMMKPMETYYEIYRALKALTPDEIFQLIANAHDKEEQDFWTVIGNYLLQKKRQQSSDNDSVH